MYLDGYTVTRNGQSRYKTDSVLRSQRADFYRFRFFGIGTDDSETYRGNCR